MSDWKQKTEAEWLELLGPERYRVLRQQGTEHGGTGRFNLHEANGMYTCGACGFELFASDSKFDSGCGWPSFDRAAAGDRVSEILDKSHGMLGTEIRCARCESHLGHVFNDGPTDTGVRFCVNSASLNFQGEDGQTEEG